MHAWRAGNGDGLGRITAPTSAIVRSCKSAYGCRLELGFAHDSGILHDHGVGA
jgi:hypothetical protein